MVHAKSLRVVGQSLEAAKVFAFELNTDGKNYVLTSESLTKTGEWILRHALNPNEVSEHRDRQPSAGSRPVCFSPADISRLDTQAGRQRRKQAFTPNLAAQKLSHLLRALGDHLDRTKARAFRISWASDSVTVDFFSPDGERGYRTFTTEKLRQLGLHSRFSKGERVRV